MEDNGEWSPEPIQRLEDFIHTFQINVSAEFGKVLEQAREELQEKSEQLEAQRQTIRELGTPILPVHEGVLVLPLVGVVDSNRATQVMEILLEAISSYQADLVIIDITGVPVVDTSVANYILQAARATKLIGAQVILVGIGAEIAQTMVHLGVDLSDIITLANLQEGLQYAFERLGISLETI
jgi:rsbT co-antagonist protein RsbR